MSALLPLTPDLLKETVGFKKGDPIAEEISKTRLGAQYLTFRDGPVNASTWIE
jgi:hypothetical protein